MSNNRDPKRELEVLRKIIKRQSNQIKKLRLELKEYKEDEDVSEDDIVKPLQICDNDKKRQTPSNTMFWWNDMYKENNNIIKKFYTDDDVKNVIEKSKNIDASVRKYYEGQLLWKFLDSPTAF